MSVRMAKSGKEKVSRVQSSQNGRTDAHHTNNKNQPTAEQLRLAQIGNDRAYNSNVDGDTIKKINQITELTGRSHDEALTALYDCDFDINRAVDRLLEKPDAENEWQEISKKKKTPANKSTTLGGGDPTYMGEREERGGGGMMDSTGGENDRERTDSVTRGGRKDRDRAPPRFQQRGGRGRGYSGNYNGGFSDRVGRERGGGSFEGSRGSRRGENGIGRSRGGGRGGSNTFNGSSHFDTHIDTWTNDSTPQNGESGTAKDKDTPIGAWSDMTEDWAADEWSGSLEESRVFTPSISSHSAVTSSTFSASAGDVSVKFDSAAVAAAASQAPPPPPTAVGQPLSDSSAAHAAASLQQQLHAGGMYTAGAVGGSAAVEHGQVMGASAAAGDGGSSYRPISAGSAAVGSPFNVSATTANQQLYNLAQMPSSVDSYGAMSNSDYMSHFSKEATECIKNAVGIGSCSTLPPQTLHTANHSQQQQQQLSNSNRTKQLKPRLPPPSKIPSSAVEMPGSMMGTQVDVQFGNWDASPSSGLGMASSATESGLSFMSDKDSLFHDPSAFSKSPVGVGGAVDLQSIQAAPQQPVLDAQLSTSAPTGVSTASLLQHINKVESAVLSGSTFPTQQQQQQLLQQQLPQQQLPQQPLPQQQQQTPPAADKRSTPVNSATFGQQQQQQTSSQTATGQGSVFKQQQQQVAQPGGSAGGSHQAVSQAPYGSYSSYTQSAVMPGSSASTLPSEFGLTGAASGNPSNQYGGYASGYGTGNQSGGGFNSNGSVYHGSGYSGNTQQAATGHSSSGYGNSATASSSTSKLYDMKPSANAGSYPAGSASALFQASVAAAAASDKQQQPQQFIPASTTNLYDPAVSAAYQSSVNVTGGSGQSSGFQAHTGSLYGNASSASSAADALQLSAGMYESQYNVGSQQQQQLYQKQQQQPRQNVGSSNVLGYQQQQQQGSQVAATTSQTASSATSAAAYRAGQHATQQVSTAGAAVPPSVGTPSVNSTASNQTKLVDGLNKLSLKEGVSAPPGINAVQYDPVTMSGVSSVPNLTTATSTTLSTSANLTTSATSSAMNTGSVTKSLSANTTSSSKLSSSFSNKTMPTMPPGIPQGTVVNQHNYLVGQPPGFQVAAFGYPTPQQPMTYSYDELQMMQQRMQMPAYFDMPFQTSTTMSSRDATAAAIGSLSTQSYADLKMNPMDALSPVSVQPSQPQQTQQQQQPGLSAAGSQQQQQQAGYPAIHPAYSFYYPSAAGLVPYGYQMIPMGSMAVPSVTNAAHGVTTSATQYQKPNNYGSHSYGQTQDFSKAFGATPAPNKGSIVTPVIGGTNNDMTSSGFGKGHMAGFDKTGAFHHGGTPPPFSMALQTGAGQAGASGAGAAGPGASMGVPPGMYPPYMPMTVQPPHQQQSQSQILHHAMPQDNSLSGRGVQPGGMGGQKVNTNKMYGAGNYWSAN